MNASSWERFCNTFHTFIRHVATEKYPLCVHRFFVVVVVTYTWGSSPLASIIVIRRSHMLAKLNAKQMVSSQATIYHTVSSFSEMWNKIDLLYKSYYNMVYNSRWWLKTTVPQTKGPMCLLNSREIFLTCSPLLFPQQPAPWSNFTLMHLL